VLRFGGGAAGPLGLGFGRGRTATGAAGLTDLGARGFLALTADLGAGDFFAVGLTDFGAGFLTAGLALERAAGAAALALFTGDGRPALRRSFAMFVLLWRSRLVALR